MLQPTDTKTYDPLAPPQKAKIGSGKITFCANLTDNTQTEQLVRIRQINLLSAQQKFDLDAFTQPLDLLLESLPKCAENLYSIETAYLMQNLMQNLECLVGSILILSTKSAGKKAVSAT